MNIFNIDEDFKKDDPQGDLASPGGHQDSAKDSVPEERDQNYGEQEAESAESYISGDEDDPGTNFTENGINDDSSIAEDENPPADSAKEDREEERCSPKSDQPQIGDKEHDLLIKAIVMRCGGMSRELIETKLQIINDQNDKGKLESDEIVRIADKVSGRDPYKIASAAKKDVETWLDYESTDIRLILHPLACLDRIDYGKYRRRVAKQVGLKVSLVDEEVQQLQDMLADPMVDASNDYFTEVEPWPEPVSNGREVLDKTASTLGRYIHAPEHVLITIALWVAFTHAFAAARVSPILAFISPQFRCGKTTTLSIISRLVPKPLPASNITSACVFRAVETWTPTLLIDEADTFLKNSDELRGILNSGHTKDMAYVLRIVGDGTNMEPRRFSTWAPKVIAMIGKLPVTLRDRAIVIGLQRKKVSEKKEKLRDGHPEENLVELNMKLARWMSDSIERLEGSDPQIPAELDDRAADNWRLLLAIADLAGGDWSLKARMAAISLTNVSDDGDGAAIQLLGDIRNQFDESKSDWLSSKDIVEALNEMEERSWPEWKDGNPITATQLAGLLSPFGIKPQVKRVDAVKTKRGYKLDSFKDTFDRYLG